MGWGGGEQGIGGCGCELELALDCDGPGSVPKHYVNNSYHGFEVGSARLVDILCVKELEEGGKA